jgi:electron transport complex protein RnfG
MKLTAQQMLRAGAVLGGFAIVAAGVLAGTHALTKDRIAAAQQQRLLTQLHAVLPADRYDNDIAADTTRFDAPTLNPSDAVTVYRARRQGQPAAAIFQVMTPDGYSGPITLLIGIDLDGTLSGVRVVAHKETPGLGDKIDADRSDWILGFTGRSLSNPGPRDWKVRKDGGIFDQFAGATITPRAVVKLIHNTLVYYSEHRETLFEITQTPQ